MKKLLFLTTLIGLVMCTGPVGPVGPAGSNGLNGKDGLSPETTILTGVLDSSSFIGDHWDIDIFDTGFTIIDCRTKIIANSDDYMWREPVWFYNDSMVRIMEDNKVKMGSGYKITLY